MEMRMDRTAPVLCGPWWAELCAGSLRRSSSCSVRKTEKTAICQLINACETMP